ncbi:ABC transporter permease [Haloarcula litorea]|uniref:ABC transporter permease n=1 Tax=Haloarcula litorea TaxID=3032579 RepID=UPI0023E8C16E|nr:ABC transporter permease subunit [Halomicroarcula sp. GDY20]
MRAAAVAAVLRQDLTDVVRARLIQAVLALYVLFVGIIYLGVSLSAEPRVEGAIQLTLLVGLLFVPLVAALAGSLAVAGERESGTIRFLLGYPLARLELVVGKLLARLLVVVGAVAVAFAVGGVLALTRFPTPRLGAVAVFGALTALFAAAYVGMAVGVSAAVGSRSRAMSGVVGLYFVFTLLWSQVAPVTVPGILAAGLDWAFGVRPSGPVWTVFANLSPAQAYFWSVQLVPGPAFEMSGAPLDGPTLVAVLAAWVVVPPALGYLRFARADIE